jgi:hypothetical protein
LHRLDLFPKNDLIYQYRKVFSSRDGLDVLEHIMYDLGVFQETSDSRENTELKNYGLRLLKILGGGYPNEDTIKNFTQRLMKQPLEKEKEQNE